MQGWRTLLYPQELIRTPAVALLFALAVLFAKPRRSEAERVGHEHIAASRVDRLGPSQGRKESGRKAALRRKPHR
jgi:hypothetical protein